MSQGQDAVRWRSSRGSSFRRRDRAVSDMVATMLIVAITVVLAAVLYIAVTSWTTTTGSAPLGSAFGWGLASNATSNPTNGCADTAHYCYTVQMIVTGTNVPIVHIALYLQTANGIPVQWPASVTAAGGSLDLFGPSLPTAAARYWPLNSTWQTTPQFSGMVTSGYSLVIFCGGAAEGAHQGLAGLEVVAVGSSGYSGTVPSPVFP